VLDGLYITTLKDTFSRKSCRTCNRSTVEQADKYYCSMSIIFSLLKGEVQLCNLLFSSESESQISAIPRVEVLRE
jgi:hypothetical protein